MYLQEVEMKLEDVKPCPVTYESFASGRKACKKCILFIICSTAISPNADEVIAKARRELGL